MADPTAPGTLDRTSSMSPTAKVGEAMRRSLPLLPEDARQTVLAMLEPVPLAIIGGTLAIWAGSHFFGVGEVVDVILVGVGVIALGFSVFDGARELLDFAKGAAGAKSDKELDDAAGHFAAAVTILGVGTIQALLLRSSIRAAVARGTPTIYPRLKVGPPPPPGDDLRLSRPDSLPRGQLGVTSPYGEIKIAGNQTIADQRETLYHELVHRYLSPRTGPLRRLRAELGISSYQRSALLRYLEEALAEGYMKLRLAGFREALRTRRFPIDAGYVTVSQMRGEGQAIGTIVLGGALFYVSISTGRMPKDEP